MTRRKLSPETKAYIRKILGFVGDDDPIALLHTGVAKIERAVRGLSPAQRLRRPAPGKWCVHEIVAHLLDAEVCDAWRLRRFFGEPGRVVEGFDQSLWAERMPYRRLPFARILRGLRETRASNLLLIDAVPARVRRRGSVMHSERGRENATRFFAMWAGHDLNHLSQIQAIRAARRA